MSTETDPPNEETAFTAADEEDLARALALGTEMLVIAGARRCIAAERETLIAADQQITDRLAQLIQLDADLDAQIKSLFEELA